MAAALEAGPWQDAPLTEPERALCAWAEKLTRTPGAMTAADVEALRRAGWDDRAIHDACQVVGYFNYINRIVDGLGGDPEPDLPAGDDGAAS